MQSLTTALENLLRHLSQRFRRHPAFVRPQRRFDALSWLASQQVYPQFYWQQRNGDEEAAVTVRVTRLRPLDRAGTVFFASTRNRRLTHLGLNAFDRRGDSLLSPRTEWHCCNGKSHATLPRPNGDVVAVKPRCG